MPLHTHVCVCCVSFVYVLNKDFYAWNITYAGNNSSIVFHSNYIES